MSGTGQLLLSDHQHLDKLFERLLDDVHCGDWTICQGTWSRFERRLLEHIEMEETYLLPIFECEYPEKTADLRKEHASIRCMLADMGVALELHSVREQDVQRFIESLQGHAAREEALLYRWAKDLAPDVAEALAHRCESPAETSANDRFAMARG
jgi:hemerythrin superfamily protein